MAEFRIQVVVDPSAATRGARRVRRELGGVENAADRVRRSVARAFAVLGSTAFLANAIRQTAQFQTAIAEVSTLVDLAVFNINQLQEAALDQAAAFGQDPQRQAQALYQIISAGASDASEAIQILNASNRLAIGGVTDVSVAAGGLTSILNAYSLSARDAADVSDILFVGVRSGITTIDQLASTLGRVAPIAATAGVELDELVATVAALTTGGISTAESVTGVRAILASIIRPTSEAASVAAELGIEFNSAALASRGLSGVLQDVIAATGGSTDLIAQLFTGTEALVPVLALTGAAGENLEDILGQMGERAGSTDAAFERISETFQFQFNRVLRNAQTTIQSLLIPALESLTPVLQAIADNFDSLTRTVGVAAAIIAGPFVGRAIVAAIVGVEALTLAIARNPIGALVIAVAAVIPLLIGFADQIRISSDGVATLADLAQATSETVSDAFRSLADVVGPILAEIFTGLEVPLPDIDLSLQGLVTLWAQTVDNILGLAVGVASAVVAAFRGIPAALDAIFVTAFNVISGRFTGFINNIIDGLNLIPGVTIDQFEAIRLEAGSTFGEIGGDVADAFIDGFNSVDVAEGVVNDVFDRAERIAQDRIADNRLIELAQQQLQVGDGPTIPSTLPGTTPAVGDGGAAGAAAIEQTNEALERQADLLREITGDREGLRQRAIDLQILFQQGAIDVQQLTEALRDLNVEVTALDNSFAGGIANGFARVAQQANNLGQQVSDFVVGAFDQLTNAIVNFAQTGEFNIRQFFGELFAQLLRLAASQLFAQLLGGFGGFGGAGGLVGGLLGFQNGASFAVAGAGGADSQLVAFRATPGERVNVETPGQVRQREQGQAAPAEPPVIELINVTDPQAAITALNTNAGSRAVLNVIEQNPQAVRRVLDR